MKIAEHLTKPISKILKFLLRRLVFVTVAIILQMIWMLSLIHIFVDLPDGTAHLHRSYFPMKMLEERKP